jgi:hypothetical protein
MSDSASPSEPTKDLSTWTIERVRSLAEDSDHKGRELEAIREVAAAHVYRSGELLQDRLQWAKLSLQVNHRMHGSSPWERARMACNNFMLRTWVIDQCGPDTYDADWNPESLAADTLAELTLGPAEARDLATHRRGLPAEQIGELRRNKNMTAHLHRLINHIQPGPIRYQLLHWVEARQLLP